jgi:four helix bundle protein
MVSPERDHFLGGKMLYRFRSYQLAVGFYRLARAQSAPRYLKDQFERAASSVALNLSEGSAKRSINDRRRYYEIALGSVRECEACIALLGKSASHLEEPCDKLARHVYRLVQALS